MDAAETGRAMEIARKKAAKRRTAKVFFMGDIKFSVFSVQFSAKAGSSAPRRRLEFCLIERLLE
jgi:hypothetical protein